MQPAGDAVSNLNFRGVAYADILLKLLNTLCEPMQHQTQAKLLTDLLDAANGSSLHLYVTTQSSIAAFDVKTSSKVCLACTATLLCTICTELISAHRMHALFKHQVLAHIQLP